jgi:RNA-binding protein
MDTIALTGAQKSMLRGHGQRMDASVKVGKDGLTPMIIAEIGRQLRARELVKIRFVGSPRGARAELCKQLSAATGSACVGSVGQTALFFIPFADPAAESMLGARLEAS